MTERVLARRMLSDAGWTGRRTEWAESTRSMPLSRSDFLPLRAFEARRRLVAKPEVVGLCLDVQNLTSQF